jgi:hypothetical protein
MHPDLTFVVPCWIALAPVRRDVGRITKGQRFQELCVETPKWFRQGLRIVSWRCYDKTVFPEACRRRGDFSGRIYLIVVISAISNVTYAGKGVARYAW